HHQTQGGRAACAAFEPAQKGGAVRRVDPVRSRVYSSALALTAALVAGCAATGNGAVGTPDSQEAQRLQAATAPVRAAQVTFDWNMTDRDARFSGRGVLRIDSGYRARVDLFGPRGETLAAAVVVDGSMRVVPGAAEQMLPPAAMLWASLGVFRAPADAPLTGTTADDGGTSLEYSRDGIRWQFRFDGDRLVGTEWTDGSGRRTVELTGNADPAFPGQAVFRDWTEFRELTLRVTDVEERAAFEPDVWILPGEH
ncbi:MAG TPA: hypothetical protein VHG09_04645, partial [Longimicrobiales bacterium]|nr:hypothetical protein [Longimicrobiales bacterium]